jgi:hypothetical protein
MATPTFKLLLNALRLGQPQEPQAAIRALVEQIAAQEETIEELRRHLQVAMSATNLLEAKATRLERELAKLIANGTLLHDEPSEPTPYSRHPSAPPPGLQAASMHGPSSHAHGPSSHGPSALGPPPSTLSTPPPSAVSAPDFDEGFNMETVVVTKKDLEALGAQEAPFKLTPPGHRAPEPARSIPGSPWARGSGAQSPSVRPAEPGETTSETGPGARSARAVEDETYPDAGGLPSLAAALGLSPDDPRIQALRPRAEEAPESVARNSERPPRR